MEPETGSVLGPLLWCLEDGTTAGASLSPHAPHMAFGLAWKMPEKGHLNVGSVKADIVGHVSRRLTVGVSRKTDRNEDRREE